MTLANAERQELSCRSLGTAALGASVRRGVGIGFVEEGNENLLISGAFGLGAGEAANGLDQIRALLEKTSPTCGLGRVSLESIWEQTLDC